MIGTTLQPASWAWWGVRPRRPGSPAAADDGDGLRSFLLPPEEGGDAPLAAAAAAAAAAGAAPGAGAGAAGAPPPPPPSPQAWRMAAWLSLLLAGYGAARAGCPAGLPADCIAAQDFLEVFTDVTQVVLYGAALGWAARVAEARRFAWLFDVRKRWWFLALFLATPPAYSAASNVRALQFTLSAGGGAGRAGAVAVQAAGGAAAAAAIAWHLRAAARAGGRAGLAAYAVPRALLLAWLAGSAAVLRRTHGAGVHLHHLYLGWGLGLWAEFNAPLSAALLALGAGIFVQGVAAYSFAPVFTPEGCFVTPTAAALSCEFWGGGSGGPFSVQVCNAVGGPAPQHRCVVGA